MADTKNAPGSPDGEPVYLVVGFLRRAHGVHGEMIMDLHTDFPERLRSGKKLFVGEAHQPMTLAGTRPHAKGILVKFKGIETPEDTAQFRNQWVSVRASEVPPLPEGQLYQHELFGFQVVDEDGHPLGELVEIIETGANDVYVVRDSNGRELLLPAIPSVILELDAARRLMRVHLLEGLVDNHESGGGNREE
ncbi:MAG TPA: ribosome maturation factor RimM [Anaerolineales bacterium]|nr:ribosome maturation factor RimM [Anaerolineales bacterium]